MKWVGVTQGKHWTRVQSTWPNTPRYNYCGNGLNAVRETPPTAANSRGTTAVPTRTSTNALGYSHAGRLARRAARSIEAWEVSMRAHTIEKQSTERVARRQVRDNPPLRSGVMAKLMLGVPIKFGAGAEIYGEGEPVEYVYEVVHGAVRTIKVLADGRRKIGGFYFAGDIFGLEEGQDHTLSAEAIVDS